MNSNDQYPANDEEILKFLQALEAAGEMRPSPNYANYKESDVKRGRGRWRVIFEWDGGSILLIVSSLSRARRIVRGARGDGSKWALFRRNKRGDVRLLNQMLNWKAK